MKLNTPYTIVCKNDSLTPTCSCDFRINIYDCPESSILIISNWVLFSYCSLLSIAAAASLWYLIKKKDQAFFLPSRRDRGTIRPRPQHIYFAMSFAHCSFQMVHSILLLTSSYANTFWAEFGHTFPVALTASVAVLYPLSIMYSTSAFEVGTNFASTRPVSLSSVISEVPIKRHAIKADLITIFALIMTFCLFLAAAALTGHYADAEDYTIANKLFLIQNLVWAIWGFLYIVTMIVFWYRFISIVLENINELTNQHQTQSSELQNKLEQLRKGTRNLSLPVYGQTITVLIYIPALILYGLYHRSNTIFNYKINLLYMIIYYFIFPVILNITQGIMIYNIITTPLNNPVKKPTKPTDNSQNNGGTKTDEKAPGGKLVSSSSNNVGEKRDSEMTGVTISELTKTDDAINEDEYNISFSKRGSTSIRFSDQYSSNNLENINEVPVPNNDINKLETLHPIGQNNGNRGSGGYSNQSDTSTLITPNSPITISYTSNTTSPRFSTSLPSSPTSPYPAINPMNLNSIINRSSISSQRESVSSTTSNASTTSSSNQRREWLAKRPAPALNRHPSKDNYKSNI